MTPLTYSVKIQPDNERGYAVSVPALPGCTSWGKSQAHALRMARLAIRSDLESLAEEDAPFPVDSGSPAGIFVRVRMPSRA